MKTNLGGFVSRTGTGLILAGLTATIAIISGCSSTANLARQQASYSSGQVDARGLFAENCARCHGADGRAKTFRGKLVGAQDFTDASWHASASTNDLIDTIKNGKKKMPAFQDKLSPSEIEALAAYVLTFPPAR